MLEVPGSAHERTIKLPGRLIVRIPTVLQLATVFLSSVRVRA